LVFSGDNTVSTPILWISTQGLLSSLRGGVGTSLSIAYVSACAIYTFSLYPFFIEGEPNLRALFDFIPFLLTLLAPTLTLDLIATETQSRHLDIWLALPISYPALLLGKIGGAWSLFMLTTLVSLFLPLSLSYFADLHWPTIWSGYLGIVLLGTMNLSIGLWASVWSKSALSAWLISFSLCFGFYLVGGCARFLPTPFAEWSQLLSAQTHVARMSLGVIDTRDLLYFFGMIVFWFTLAVETLRIKTNAHIEYNHDN
jgi:ABC-2 type transport system permease protein